jgi:site-specific DNA recombinase
MLRAVIYCRVSTKEQAKNLSLPVQEKACRDYCKREGYEVIATFVDEGESAKTLCRGIGRLSETAVVLDHLDVCFRKRLSKRIVPDA